MSLIIHNVIVHRIAAKEQQLVVLPRQDTCEVAPEIEQLAQELNHIYNSKPGKGVGGFSSVAELERAKEELEQDAPEPEEGAIPQATPMNPYALNEFQLQLDKLIAGEHDFVSFSRDVAGLLAYHLQSMSTDETGFLVFSHFQFLATDYLLISLLDTKEHVEVSGELDFSINSHLDLAKMQLAARVDITQYQTSPAQNRYISFIKGRIGRKVSDFFMHFLGCEELVDIKKQNKQLLENVEQYLENEEFDPHEKQESRQMLVDYYKEKLEAGEDVTVKDIAETLSKDDQKQDFYAFAQSLEEPLEENFQPDRAAIKTLNKFSGQGGGISMNFDRKLLGEKVFYDAQNDILTIKGLPANLRDQLNRWQD
ncbi:nucleoid-associated protein [Alteromonas sp. a30]|uniref:nucleoid-associated protein n=1 Tax=Alteromonas sp. a30 TaxID=2730917 RepID=UPI0022814A3B|nr:nucleoid-associated protein [Alteromonas sp. a30]MCY7294154.1 nucleoid-associated protein YejK [Alteromonas sp. a30]